MAHGERAGLELVERGREADQEIDREEAEGRQRAGKAERRERAERQGDEAAQQDDRDRQADRRGGRAVPRVHGRERAGEIAVAGHREQQARDGVERGEQAGQAADQGAEIHRRPGRAEARPLGHGDERRAAVAQGARVVAHAQHHEIGDGDEEQAGQQGAHGHRQPDIAGGVARLAGERRGAFEADEAQHREGERSHDAAVSEVAEIELLGIDHGAALGDDDGGDQDQDADRGDLEDQPEARRQADVAPGGEAGHAEEDADREAGVGRQGLQAEAGEEVLEEQHLGEGDGHRAHQIAADHQPAGDQAGERPGRAADIDEVGARQRMAPRQGGDVEGDEEHPGAGDQEAEPRAAAGEAGDDGDVDGGRERRRHVRHRLADAVHQPQRIAAQLRPIAVDRHCFGWIKGTPRFRAAS